MRHRDAEDSRPHGPGLQAAWSRCESYHTFSGKAPEALLEGETGRPKFGGMLSHTSHTPSNTENYLNKALGGTDRVPDAQRGGPAVRTRPARCVDWEKSRATA